MKKALLAIIVLIVVIVGMVILDHNSSLRSVTYSNSQPKNETIPTEIKPSIIIATTSPTLSIIPEKVIQGEPVMLTIEGVDATSSVTSVTFDHSKIATLPYQGKIISFIGIDLNKKPATYPIRVELNNGEILEKNLIVAPRKKDTAPFTIPEKLGGDTPASADHLVSTLSKENAILNSVNTASKAYWEDAFIFPLPNPRVTDPYGYIRQTDGYDISHKGTDFHADKGTAVMAMNRGIVRSTSQFTVYGKTIIIDHGLGLMTFYMHLSQINVKEGQLVEKGEIIGKSGDTGYAEVPHLHITVRINNISIDPMKFMAFFQ